MSEVKIHEVVRLAPITGETICLNCKKPEAYHCEHPSHWLRCCPLRCPAEPNGRHHFYPPQPTKPEPRMRPGD